MQHLPPSPSLRFRTSLAATLLISGTIAVGIGANLVRLDSTCSTSEVDTHTVVIESHNGVSAATNPCLRVWNTAPQGYGLLVVGAALFVLGGLAAIRRVGLATFLTVAALTLVALAIFYFKMDGYCPPNPRLAYRPDLCMKGATFAWSTRGVAIALGAVGACVLALVPVTGIHRRRGAARA